MRTVRKQRKTHRFYRVVVESRHNRVGVLTALGADIEIVIVTNVLVTPTLKSCSMTVAN